VAYVRTLPRSLPLLHQPLSCLAHPSVYHRHRNVDRREREPADGSDHGQGGCG
jgi:hypothetical protein